MTLFFSIGLVCIFFIAKKIITITKQNRICEKCGQLDALVFISSDQGNNSIQKIFPNKFEYRQYQVVYKCKYCGWIKVQMKFVGKNRNVFFD